MDILDVDREGARVLGDLGDESEAPRKVTRGDDRAPCAGFVAPKGPILSALGLYDREPKLPRRSDCELLRTRIVANPHLDFSFTGASLEVVVVVEDEVRGEGRVPEGERFKG